MLCRHLPGFSGGFSVRCLHAFQYFRFVQGVVARFGSAVDAVD